jgi:hypothetical protein
LRSAQHFSSHIVIGKHYEYPEFATRMLIFLFRERQKKGSITACSPKSICEAQLWGALNPHAHHATCDQSTHSHGST